MSRFALSQTVSQPSPLRSPHVNVSRLLIATLLLLALAFAGNAMAGPGHDHGDAPAAPVGTAAPRFVAASELFELVGVLDGSKLTVHLDHAPTNAPVKGARVELEVAGKAVSLEPHGDGEFIATLVDLPKEGTLPVTATVFAGNESDLLAGELDLHGPAPAGGAAHTHGWEEWLPWALGGSAALVVAIVIVARRRRTPDIRLGDRA